jgi:hypothetical protein
LLRLLSIDQLVDALNAFAKCPQQLRPQMSPDWLEAFLAATGSHLQQAMPVSSPGSPATQGSSEVVPHHLLELARGVPYLPAPPPRAWQSQFVLAAVGMIPQFSGQQSAELLIALAAWKQTVAAHMATGSSSAEAAAAAHAAFASCLPLYDALMLAVSRAGGIAPPSVGTADGGLGLRAVQMLPAALHVLQWPVDEEVVAAVQGYIAGFQSLAVDAVGKVEAELDKRQKQLQKVQEGDSVYGNSGSDSSKKLRKSHGRSRQHAQPSSNSKQQQQQQMLQLEYDVSMLQGAKDEALGMIESVELLSSDWEQLLHPSDAADVLSAAAASAEHGSSNSSAAGSSWGGDDRMVGGLDVDSLMAGMLQAAGVPQPGAAPPFAGDAAMAGIVADLAGEVDELLSGLGTLESYSWQLVSDDDDESGDGEGGKYIDTVAEDVV